MGRLTSKDKSWLKANQIALFFYETETSSVIEGRLKFNRKGYVESLKKEIARDDAYLIRIEIPENDTVPRVYETGGRLEKAFNKHRAKLKSELDLHMYKINSEVCLCAPQQLEIGYQEDKSVQHLMEMFVIPFFYSQSYFEEYGEWPWDHLPHDAPGIIEWYLNNHELPGAARETIKALQKFKSNNMIALLNRGQRRDSFNPNNKCLCGSSKSFLACDPRHRALLKLALEIRLGPHRRNRAGRTTQ